MGCPSALKINRRLLPVKGSYFFALAAVASLLPYLSVYMKQLGLTPAETAIIYGTMPFLSAFVRPIIGAIADRLHQHKAVLVICCITSGALHASLLFVPPVTPVNPDLDLAADVKVICDKENSQIQYCIDTRTEGKDCHIPAKDLLNLTSTSPDPFLNSSDCVLQCDLLVPEGSPDVGLCFTSAKQEPGACAKKLLYENDSTPELEFILDEMNHSLTRYHFGNQNLDSTVCHFYSMSAFLFNGTAYQKLYCQSLTVLDCHVRCERFSEGTIRKDCAEDLRDYRPKFSASFWLFFSVYLLAQIAFSPIFSLIDAMTYNFLGEERGKWGKQRLWGTLGFSLAAVVSGLSMDVYTAGQSQINYTLSFGAFALLKVVTSIVICQYKISSALTCSQMMKNIGQLCRKLEVMSLFVVVLFFGALTGVIELFLFWHLQVLGASQLLMGLCMFTNCILEVPILFLSGRIMNRIGEVRCIYIVFVAYCTRFVAYSFLLNPWFALFIEPLHGITFGLMYAAASSYASIITPPGMHGTIQGLIGGLHFGFGKGIGSLVGGLVFQVYGAVTTFRSCSIASGVVFLLYVACQQYITYNHIKQLQKEKEAEDKVIEVSQMLTNHAAVMNSRTNKKVLSTDHQHSNGMVRDHLSQTPLVPTTPTESSV